MKLRKRRGSKEKGFHGLTLELLPCKFLLLHALVLNIRTPVATASYFTNHVLPVPSGPCHLKPL